MTASEVTTLLDQVDPPLIGVVATVRADGSPHAVPVWYGWDGQAVSIWTDHERAWVRNLVHDPRAAFTAQQGEPPYGAVIIRGRAEISAPGDDVGDEIRRIARRYLPEADCDGYIAAWPDLRTIVRIRPLTVRAWSRGY